MHTISDIHIVWNARKNDKYDDKTPIIINKLDITDQRVTSYYHRHSIEIFYLHLVRDHHHSASLKLFQNHPRRQFHQRKE